MKSAGSGGRNGLEGVALGVIRTRALRSWSSEIWMTNGMPASFTTVFEVGRVTRLPFFVARSVVEMICCHNVSTSGV